MHFGAGSVEAERAKERDLLRCLRSHVDTGSLDHLYLVGDVFDGFIEYRHLVPKGCVRLLGRLAQWSDAGLPITYLVGNHDLWHRDYFRTEVGVDVVESVDAVHHGVQMHIEHGDAVGSAHGLYPALRPLLRHPLSRRLYRSLLPADAGLGLARWVSDAVRHDEPDPDLVAALRRTARARLAGDDDLVVMGHCHVPTLDVPAAGEDASGAYLNTGTWFNDRTFGRLDADGVHLCTWNGTRADSIEATEL
jgi:UDP-2,3-diacylglucosamine hydrolase